MFPVTTKVLICEETLTMRKFLKKCLTDLGFKNISEAKDGTEALLDFMKAADDSAPFGLVLSEWNMPYVTGIELLKKIRAHPLGKRVPFLMVTSKGDAAAIKEAVQAGVDGYVIKPFSVATLQERLDVAWKKYRS